MSISKFLLITMMIWLSIRLRVISSLNFNEKEYKTGLVFVELGKGRVSYDSYTMLLHINISPYKELTTHTEKCIQEIDKVCWDLKNRNVSYYGCDVILEELQTHLGFMKGDEAVIDSYQQKKDKKRAKRYIQLLGTFLHWANGVMDAETALAYDEKINELQDATTNIHNIQKEQMIIIKEEIRDNKVVYE